MCKVKEKIKQRRQQMLVHSILYYEFDSPIISDKKYDVWARELVQLQKNIPKRLKILYYVMFLMIGMVILVMMYIKVKENIMI